MRLHLGCGNVHINEFTNVDNRKLPGVDIVDDVRFLEYFDKEDVSEIYACHILEHFERHEVNSVLQRWYNVLSSGGMIRISVPDFDSVVNQYKEKNNLPELMGLLYGGQNYPGNYHFCCWNFDTLKSGLEEVGFSQVARYDWEETEFASFDDFSKAYLPHMDTGGRLMSLNIQAIKS